jgi:beta-1,4-mannosyltransferase
MHMLESIQLYEKSLYEEAEIYKGFTLDKYNKTIENQYLRKKHNLGKLAAFSILTGLAFPGSPIINTAFDASLHLLKFSWLIPLPYFAIYNAGISSFSKGDLVIDVKRILDKKEDISDKRVIYTIVTRGLNINSVENSAKSVLYWTRRIREDYKMNINSDVWIITEEDTYKTYERRYDELRNLGVKVFAVPAEYKTKNNTKFKARALNYATELRKELGFNTKNDWVYHQDEETMVGEDTILGNIDFILNSGYEKVCGTGIILYPQNWKNKVTFVKEFVRPSNDYRMLGCIKLLGFGIFGYHGSHFICRADAEETIGWDFGEIKAEDLLFTINLSKRYKKGIGVMRGFAYEKPPFTIGDHLKQRRRWVLGTIDFIKRNDIELKYKVSSIYSLVSWYSAVPSLVATVLNILYPTGGMFIMSGALAGLVWYSLFNMVRDGYHMHYLYLNKKPKNFGDKAKLISNAILGLFVESLAPWYAILKRTNSFECVKKD